MRIRFLIILLVVSFHWGFTQKGRVESKELLYSIAQRYEALYGSFPRSMGNGVLFRSDIYEYLEKVSKDDLSPRSEFFYEYVSNEIQEKNTISTKFGGWKSYVYNVPAYFFSVKRPKYWIAFNPGFHGFIGKEIGANNLIDNSRIVSIKGDLGKSIYFSSTIYENQSIFPSYVNKSIKRSQTLSGYTRYKTYNFPFFKDVDAIDYLNAEGYAGYQFNSFFNAELGHGKHHLGYGIRSMLLSNQAPNYLYLRMHTGFWKIRYQNIFQELFPFSDRLISGDQYFPKKYAANHLLTFQLTKNFELSFFESVVFSRSDHFDFQYLNPIILYRAVELNLNSSDNVLVGVQSKYNIFSGFQLYGQLVLDEFHFSKLKRDFNYWGNKWAGQLGVRYINAFSVPFLDIVSEINVARPFMYTHFVEIPEYGVAAASYSHYGQPMAHPMGSNFYEWISTLTYKPAPKWWVKGRFIYAKAGLDSDNQTVGQSILTPNGQRLKDSYKLLEGEAFQQVHIGAILQYMFYHNMSLECKIHYRNVQTNVAEYFGDSFYAGLGLRINVFHEHIDY